MSHCEEVRDKLLELLKEIREVEYRRGKKKHILDCPGGVLYSSYETVKSGDCMIFGLNPRGDINEENCKIKKDIEEVYKKSLRNPNWNAFFDEVWDEGKKPGESRLQLRMRCFAKLLMEEEEKLRSICCSNIVFVQSENVKQIPFEDLAETCWKVNEWLIKEVRPKYIFVFGKPGYQFLKKKLSANKEKEPINAKWGRWTIEIAYNDKVYIIGIPHLSRYTFEDRKEVVNQIKEKIGGLTCSRRS